MRAIVDEPDQPADDQFRHTVGADRHGYNRRDEYLPASVDRSDESMPLKLFVVGFPKSGTSTLQNALTRSGLKSAHWSDPVAGYVGPSMYKRYFRGEDPMTDFADFDAVTQADVTINGSNYWPQLDFSMLRAIQRYHPDCLFTLNYRAPEETAASMIKWADYGERLRSNDIPGLPKRYGRNAKELATWIGAHHEALRHFFRDSDHFFEYDIADPKAPELLGDRLGIPIKWWGQSNVNNAENPAVKKWAELEQDITRSGDG